jgi:hypothetical protein
LLFPPPPLIFGGYVVGLTRNVKVVREPLIGGRVSGTVVSLDRVAWIMAMASSMEPHSMALML